MNVLENTIISTPSGVEDTCAKLTIDDTTLPFIFHNISQADEAYTLSFWVCSEAEGSIMVGGATIATTSEWTKHVVNFVADSENVPMYFKTAGLYYMYNSQLEIGGHATDWRPAIEDVDDKISVAISISEEGIRSEVSSIYATQDSLLEVSTVAHQTAAGFQWLVSGEDETSFTLTEAGAELIASIISLNGNVKIDGTMLVDGCVTADKIDVADLFAQEIIATNMIITGDSVLNGVTATNLTVTGNSTFEGVLNGATGSFSGHIEASSGNFGYLFIGTDAITATSTLAEYPDATMQLAPWYTFFQDAPYTLGLHPSYILLDTTTANTGDLMIDLRIDNETPLYIGQLVAGSGYDPLFYFDITEGLFLTKKITINSESATVVQVKVKNTLHEGALYLSEYGNFGLRSATHSRWTIVMDSDGLVKVNDSIAVRNATSGAGIRPLTDDVIACGGESYRWTKVWAKSGIVSTSDEREKDILDDVDLGIYSKLFMDIKPIAYRWRSGKDPNIYFGVGAKSLEQLFIAHGFNPDELGLIEHNLLEEPAITGQTDRYGLNYQNLQMLTLMQTQKNARELENLTEWKRVQKIISYLSRMKKNRWRKG